MTWRARCVERRRWPGVITRRSRTGAAPSKSHFVEALGHLAIDQGKTVAWYTLETLAQLVHRHRADDSITKAISKPIRADLVIIS
jgi:hypothetical protein